MENVKISKTKGEGKIKANITVTEGRITALFSLKESKGKYYLENPAKLVPSLKGKKFGEKVHSGFIDLAYITDPEWIEEIKKAAIAELGLPEL